MIAPVVRVSEPSAWKRLPEPVCRSSWRRSYRPGGRLESFPDHENRYRRTATSKARRRPYARRRTEMMLTRKVLLLNASYEPLGTISAPRALRLVWKDAAQVVEVDGDRVLRSPRFVFAVPSVVRLVAYLNLHNRQRRAGNMRAGVIARDRHRCQYCGVRGTVFELTLDHIL